MKSHWDHGAHIDYNLEAIAEILASKFQNSFICVIRPEKVELKTFSCFSNFVVCNRFGSPTHLPNNNSLLYLKTLLQSIAERTGFTEIGYESPLVIIGFSKGCVVLNQLLHEFHYFNHLPKDQEISHVGGLIGRIKKMIWLDGGHSGGKDTWITSSAILSSLQAMGNMKKVKLS